MFRDKILSRVGVFGTILALGCNQLMSQFIMLKNLNTSNEIGYNELKEDMKSLKMPKY